MRTNRITLAAVAGATLAAGIAAPAAAHTTTHHGSTVPTVASTQSRLAASTTREEAFLTQAKSWVAGSSALDQAEKDALTNQLAAALTAVKSAASTGASATTVDVVSSADHAADQAFWGALRSVFTESATITSAEHQAATITALQAKLAALVSQYTAHDVPGSPAAAEAGTLLTMAAGDATAARAAAISDPATAAKDLAAARSDEKKAVSDIASAAHALATALKTAAPTTTTKPTTTKPTTKPVSDPTSTKPCTGHHAAVDPRSHGRDTGYNQKGHHSQANHHSGSHHGGSSSQARPASFHH